MLKLKGIKNRWFITVYGTIIIILIVIIVVFAVFLQNYYYTGIEGNITSRAATTSNFYKTYLSSQYQDIYSIGNALINEFPYKDKIEMQILDDNGTVIFSTLGFVPEDPVDTQDFIDAKNGKNSASVCYNKYTKEKYMAYTVKLDNAYGYTLAYARYSVSLIEADKQVLTFVGIFSIIGLIIVVLVGISSQFFIRGIVTPLSDITAVSEKIAKGDFNTRLSEDYRDEMGDLCKAINYMAQELANTEQTQNDFISQVSHELRTPLTAIRGWSETALSSCGDEKMMERGLIFIKSETDRLSKMVEELLEFSNIQADRLKINIAKTEVLDVFEETVFMMMGKAKREKNITLTYDNDSIISPILGDKDRLKQVFFNILDNAVKHTEEGGIINTSINQNDNIINITIKDFGSGIPSAEIEKVKQKFYKAKDNTKSGTGLGLSIADEIITKHHGKLIIESRENEYTKITIQLPCYIPEEPKEEIL